MVAPASGTRGSDEPFNVDDEPPAATTGVSVIALRVRELIAFAAYYVAAQVDRFKLTAINIAMFVILGAVAAFVGVAVVLTAGVLLVVGVAGGLGELFGGRRWAGDLVTAVVILGVLLGGTVVAFKIVTKSTRGKLVAAYEQRKREQRSSFGTDVDEQSR
jgi:hypothetical protein